MTTLPSFVELMATLGLDQAPDTPPQKSGQQPASSPPLLNVTSSSPVRSRSSPSLRDQALLRGKGARYSPYGANTVPSRRGSVSSISSSSPELERRALSTSPHPPSPRRRRFENGLSVRVHRSVSDLPANTPISSLVRRKTPNGSPISPSFPSNGYHTDSPIASPMPFSIPTLPTLIPYSSSSDSLPITPRFELEYTPISRHNSPRYKLEPLPDVIDIGIRRSRYHHDIRTSQDRFSQPQILDLS